MPRRPRSDDVAFRPSPAADGRTARRDALRAAGLRPVQIWVPDTGRPGFAAECRRQARLVAMSDASDTDLEAFMESALEDIGDETAP